MDFVLNLVPESNHVVCEKLNYAVKQTDLKPGAGKPGAKTGFVREWALEGSCDEEGRAILSRLQESAALNRVFNVTAQRLGDASFALSGQRTAKGVLRDEVSPRDQPGGLSYQFRLLVTETFPNDDALAIAALPKPVAKQGARP